MLTTGNQLKAARALVGMEQTELAGAAGVSANTVRNMEASGSGAISGRAQTVQAIQRALEAVGVEFLNHGQPGVRLAQPVATMVRVKADTFNRLVHLEILYRARSFHIKLAVNVLDDLDRTNHVSAVAIEDALRRHRGLILELAAAKIDSLQAEATGPILLDDAGL